MVNTIDDDYRLPERIRRGDGLESLHDTNCDNSRLRSENNAKRRVMRTDEAFKILRNAAWLGSNEERDAIEEAVAMACNALANIEQITWERDTAIDQLHMLGYSLGEKPRKNGDLISRQAAIDSIEKHLRFGDELYPLTDTDKVLNHGFEIAASCVYNLPSAQPEHRWIPCSERLPDKPNVYTVTDHDGRVVRYAYYDNESSREYWKRCAKAWMPLPEPYKEGQE